MSPLESVVTKILICGVLIGLAALMLRSRFNLALFLLVMAMVVGFIILDRR